MTSNYKSRVHSRPPPLHANCAHIIDIVAFHNVANYGTAVRDMAGWIWDRKPGSWVKIEHGIKIFVLMLLFIDKNVSKLLRVD